MTSPPSDDPVAMMTPAEAIAECPVCGAWLTPLDLETPDDEYLCPLCATDRKPRVGLAGPG